MPMVSYLSLPHAHFHKPFAVKLYELLSRMMLFGKRYLSMPTKNQHRHSATQAVADDYNVVRIMPLCQRSQFAELTAFHGAMSIAFLFTYSLRNVSASIMPVSMSASDVARFV